MRVPLAARVLIAAVVTTGATLALLAILETPGTSLAPLALLAAAVVVTELIRVPSDESSPDPADANEFSFSSGVHIAAVLVVGPWAAALVAVFGVVAVDGTRGARWRHVSYNASVFALAVLGGGACFAALGGQPGELAFPGDFAAVVGLGVTYYLVNSTLVSSVVALAAARPVVAQVLATVHGQLLSSAGEIGFGVALAFFALTEPWAAVVLAPLVLALFKAHSRLAQLRRETARALDTFASVVDERDPSTYHHSERVAEHVRRLGDALGLPPAEVNRLRWAGRLHDLGKIAVDGAVLRKPGRLSPSELEAIRRHPRLSARLVRPFRFAAGEARAVEYHHERYDGRGYYGIDGESLPLAAHFLIVADSFDAMTSDRSYRKGLSVEDALIEIEAGAGTQFHPVVARAFVALQRGLDPAGVVSREELSGLRAHRRGGRRLGLGTPHVSVDLVALAITVAGLATVAAGIRAGAVGLAVGAAALARRRVQIARADRLADRLAAALAAPDHPSFEGLAEALAGSCRLSWAAIVSWPSGDSRGRVVTRWGAGARAAEAPALRWLLRDLDSGDDLCIGRGSDLGGDTVVAVPLSAAGVRDGFLLAGFPRRVPEHVESALRRSAPAVSSALTPYLRTGTAAARRLAAL